MVSVKTKIWANRSDQLGIENRATKIIPYDARVLSTLEIIASNFMVGSRSTSRRFTANSVEWQLIFPDLISKEMQGRHSTS